MRTGKDFEATVRHAEPPDLARGPQRLQSSALLLRRGPKSRPLR
jgi:hypothetical protein